VVETFPLFPTLPPSLTPYLSDLAFAYPLDDQLLQDAVDGVGIGDRGLREGGEREINEVWI